MKSNNIFMYIFIIVVVIMIGGALYILNNQNKELSSDENEIENSTQESAISIVENLKVGITNYDTMNPILTKNKEILYFDNLIFDPLINVTSDYRLEYSLAKSCEQKDDTTYMIKLDSNVKWQDGSNLISKDVAFTIEKLKENDSTYSGNVKYVTSVDTPDSETIIIHLSEPVRFFEYNLSFPILSNSYYTNEDFNNSSKIPIGTGMYKIASIDNENILLIRNDRWRNIKSSPPKTQSITIHKYSAIGEIFNSFKLGNIDIVNTNMTNYSEYVGTMGYNKKEYKGREYDYLSFNCQDTILQDSAVRRAIEYAINKDTIVSTVFNDSKITTQGPLDYGSHASVGDGLLSYSQDNARKELENAGWVYANNKWQKTIDGYIKKLNLSLCVSKDNEDRIKVANSIKQQLKDIGIIININQVDNDKYTDYLNNKDYQIILTGVTNSINPDLTYFYGNNNIANYSNDDAMSILGSFDKYQELQKIVNNDCPYIPLYRNKGTLILNANVGGNFLPNNFNIYYNFEKWFRQR